MSALSSFLGGAVIGAGTAYTKLADEQRAFRIDQTKQDALYSRMLNLKRAEKGMEKSGVLDKDGLPMTNEEVDQYGEDRSALKGPIVAAAEIQKLKEADQPSQYMRNGVVLTKGEVAELQGDFSGVVPVYTQRRMDEKADRLEAQEYQEGRDEARFTRQEELQNQRLTESEKRAIKVEEAREAKQLSQFVNLQTRQILTKGEVEEYRRVHGSFDGLSTVGQIQRQDTIEGREYQEGRDAARFTRQEELQNQRLTESEKRAIKAEEDREARAAKATKNQWDLVKHKDFESSYETMRKDIKKNASIVEKEAKDGAYPSITGNKTKDVRIYRDEVVIDTMAGWAEGLPKEDLMKANERDPNFFNIIAMPEILLTGTVGEGSDKVSLAEKSVEEVKEVMKTKGIDEYTINRFIDYATVKGYIEYTKGSKRKGINSTWVFKPPVSNEE